MTVEIRELVIRAVTTLASEEIEEPPDWARNDANDAEASPFSTTLADRDALIQDCVRQVLRILQRTRER